MINKTKDLITTVNLYYIICIYLIIPSMIFTIVISNISNNGDSKTPF